MLHRIGIIIMAMGLLVAACGSATDGARDRRVLVIGAGDAAANVMLIGGIELFRQASLKYSDAVLSPGGFITNPWDAISLGIAPCLVAITAMVEACLDAVTAPIQSLLDPVAARIKLVGACEHVVGEHARCRKR